MTGISASPARADDAVKIGKGETTMKFRGYFPVTPVIAALIILPVTGNSRSGGFKNFWECSAQCNGFTGSMKIKCIETCSRMSRGERGGKTPNENFRTCDELCRDFKGINNVKCVRICLERIKKKKEEGNTNGVKREDPCTGRCTVFNEPLKSQCLRRCRREVNPNNRRSVW